MCITNHIWKSESIFARQVHSYFQDVPSVEDPEARAFPSKPSTTTDCDVAHDGQRRRLLWSSHALHLHLLHPWHEPLWMQVLRPRNQDLRPEKLWLFALGHSHGFPGDRKPEDLPTISLLFRCSPKKIGTSCFSRGWSGRPIGPPFISSPSWLLATTSCSTCWSPFLSRGFPTRWVLEPVVVAQTSLQLLFAIKSLLGVFFRLTKCWFNGERKCPLYLCEVNVCTLFVRRLVLERLETKRGKKLPQMLSGRIIRENYWLKQLPDGFASL